MTTGSKQDNIIDSYVALLSEQGLHDATIEATARHCGLSKAGLLHHFPSRQALDAGLVSRLRTLIDDDVAAMAQAPERAVHYYLASSLDEASPLERMVVAATRLAQSGNEEAAQVLRSGRDRWYALLVEALGDPALAKLALLAGDGLSYHLDITRGARDGFMGEGTLDELVALLVNRQPAA
ncbi:TetR/AcrR family transcriptional regulator [Arthrobacter sp. NPDC097144]|uniref:TetR/AcrR family transcriptional regulator n=1 Tax=Arthrobacter sp. NPDC097144 TaxID=3363946 RepID=UPI0038042306